MTEEPLFDSSLKKKSKKKNVDFAAELDAELNKDKEIETKAAETVEAQDAPSKQEDKPADNADADLFGGMKKKSKSKKKFDMDLDLDEPTETPSTTTTTEATGLEDDFSDMKKKKKSKSKKAAFDLDAFEKDLKSDGNGTSTPQGGDDGEDGEVPDGDYKPDGDLGDDPFAANDDDEAGLGEEKELKMDWLGSDRDYTYQELLGRIFSTLRAQNPALSSDRKKYTIVPPQVQRDGSKKTVFANIADICRRMHRQPEHVIQFLFAELGTMGSIDGTGRLVIRGRFQPKQIENVLRRYIVEYVTCKTCKSPSTLLTKENRIYFMTCESCGSQRSVSAIKAGFQAQVGKRSKNKVA